MSDNISKPTLLLVEDQDDDVFFFKRTFDKVDAGLSFHHVYNGSEAIEFLRNTQNSNRLPQIIFLDLKMPVLNGFDVLTWMQTQKFSHNIPVVVLSGSEQQSDKEHARQLGAADYLVKPLGIDDFKRILSSLFLPPGGSGATV